MVIIIFLNSLLTLSSFFFFFFFFNDTATTEIYTLSLHDALPIYATMLWTSHAQTVAQVLRAARHPLSQQEIADATASRLSFGPNDGTIIDTDAAILFDPEGEDVRDLIEFANTQLLEMRYLDHELDDVLEGAYEILLARRWRRGRLAPVGPDLRSLARLQLDAAILFEQGA